MTYEEVVYLNNKELELRIIELENKIKELEKNVNGLRDYVYDELP